MRGNLRSLEPSIVDEWVNGNLFQRIQNVSNDRKKFTLHFGPPYANGHIHIGHALIGILKDAVVKSYRMAGYNAPLVIGWDCHGLPIEWKIEELYLKQKKKREDIPIPEFMAKCREFAGYWSGVQKEEFQKLGIIADFQNPYSTMHKESEATICAKFFEIVQKGLVYRGKKPVMWSVVEKTALAEAELVYQDKVSDAIFVKFPVIKAKDASLIGTFAVIWTTTPWTIPGNKAIAYSKDFEYSVIKIAESQYIIATALIDHVLQEIGVTEYEIVKELSSNNLDETVCEHPLKNLGFNDNIRFLPASHVTIDTGTGLVHTAPAHGLEDFILGKEYGLPIENVVEDDGLLSEKLPYFQREHVFKVNPKIIEELEKANRLLHSSKLTHSYPHSWRSNAPLIFRTTTQWFISISDIREKLLSEIDKTEWFPSGYVNRIRSMVEKRPDWCISRQRIWGVPIALFVEKNTNHILMDDEIFTRIVTAFRNEGIESWHTKPAEYFLGNKYNPEDYLKVTDTLEVWFDSACSHHYVLEHRPDLEWPADLYFEGSDQHRGWFQSSLVESVCTSGKAPYKQVATNGFVLDKDGKKMSKSTGNVVSPDDIISKLGADVLRLWCLNSDYSEDTRIGNEILSRQQDIYRRFRNTLRYLLGVISCYDPLITIDYDDLPELEKVVLHQLYELDSLHKESIKKYEFQRFCSALHSFCANDLSAFYFDIRKDTIYCDVESSIKRRSCVNVMNDLFVFISHWLAPILSFTAEEAWLCYPLNVKRESIHLETFPKIYDEWHNPEMAAKWQIIKEIRKSITKSIEIERSAKVIGSSLEAEIQIYTSGFQEKSKQLAEVDLAELLIVSKAAVISAQMPHNAVYYEDTEIGIVVMKASGIKCERCWKVSSETSKHYTKQYGEVTVCPRCLKFLLQTDS
ncbi:MAG: isoleucine--tRNA ligase [Holosporales bacterium]|nr:isoleucine--tRNA ligase [Holosporales bacterium]